MSVSIALPPAPPARSNLARYRLLSPTASIRVSPLCIGGMSFGSAWKDYMGECDQPTTEEILDRFYSEGGNFIDTSGNYQFGQSEEWIGAWMAKRGVRDQMVVATKYTTNTRGGKGADEIIANFQGNGAKSLHLGVEGSLRRLQTSYIDLLYVHWWDFSTSIPEVMQSLNHLVAAGKVLHLGISDSPAWVVSRANEYARNHGLRQFSVYQGRWNAGARDFERDIIPMVRAEGMGLAPWGVLGGGAFKSAAQREAEASGKGRSEERSAEGERVSQALENVARRKGEGVTHLNVALAYVLAKEPYVFPLIGCRTLRHLEGNVNALAVKLSDDDIKEIEDASPLDPGFPMSFLYGEKISEVPGQVWLAGMGGEFDHVGRPKPLNRE